MKRTDLVFARVGHVFEKRVIIACIIYNTKSQGVIDIKEETQRLPEL